MTRCLAIVLLALVAAPLAAQDRPGPAHQELARLAGTWTQELTYSMGGPPMKVRGTATNRMILGGRFLVSERTAEAPAMGSMPATTLEAMNIYGFDGRTKQYTIVEFDTMGTYWVSASGVKTANGAITMSGESLDSHGGTRETRKFDMTLLIVDDDTYKTQIVFRFADRPALTVVEGRIGG